MRSKAAVAAKIKKPYRGDSRKIANNKAEQRQNAQAKEWQERHKHYLPILMSLHADILSGKDVQTDKVKNTVAAVAACRFLLECPDYAHIARKCFNFYEKTQDKYKLQWFRKNYAEKSVEVLPVGITTVGGGT